MCLLVYSGRLLDSFFCLLSLALYYLCTRERDHCNFTCCQCARNRGRASLGDRAAPPMHARRSVVLCDHRFACWHPFPSAVILLFVMSCTQLFFSSFRLLMLLVGTADEMAPPESKTKFAVFAIGAVAAPVIHVRKYKQQAALAAAATGGWGPRDASTARHRSCSLSLSLSDRCVTCCVCSWHPSTIPGASISSYATLVRQNN